MLDTVSTISTCNLLLSSSIENISTNLQSIQRVKCGDLITSDRQNNLVSVTKDFVDFLHKINKLYRIVEITDCKSKLFTFSDKLTIDSSSYFSIKFSYPFVTIVDNNNYLVEFVLMYKKIVETSSGTVEENIAKIIYKKYVFSQDFSTILFSSENEYVLNNVKYVEYSKLLQNFRYTPPFSNTSSFIADLSVNKAFVTLFNSIVHIFNLCKQYGYSCTIAFSFPDYKNNVLIFVLKYSHIFYEVLYLKYYM